MVVIATGQGVVGAAEGSGELRFHSGDSKTGDTGAVELRSGSALLGAAGSVSILVGAAAGTGGATPQIKSIECVAGKVLFPPCCMH